MSGLFSQWTCYRGENSLQAPNKNFIGEKAWLLLQTSLLAAGAAELTAIPRHTYSIHVAAARVYRVKISSNGGVSLVD